MINYIPPTHHRKTKRKLLVFSALLGLLALATSCSSSNDYLPPLLVDNAEDKRIDYTRIGYFRGRAAIYVMRIDDHEYIVIDGSKEFSITHKEDCLSVAHK